MAKSVSWMFSAVRRALKQANRTGRVLARRVIGYPIVYNVNKVKQESLSKRALLVYLVKPFKVKDSDQRFFLHQNLRQCKQIASVIGGLGYVVDVVDVKGKRMPTGKTYDLIISHKVDLPGVSGLVNPGTVIIYLSSGLNHVHSNRNLQRRYQLFRARRGCDVKLRRAVPEYMPYVETAQAIVGFGNELTMSTWKSSFGVPTYCFNNYGFPVSMSLESKDYRSARKNFLYLASSGQILKGLDLLLEVFPKHPDLHLYVCGPLEDEPDFCRCYYEELYRTSNIHNMGWISVTGETFHTLMEKCAYTILLSCSEGQAGSVVQGMRAGLIPVVTKEVGIDTEDFGITLLSDDLNAIEDAIVRLSSLPEDWHREQSFKTSRAAEDRFTEVSFVKEWNRILKSILAESRTKVSGKSA